MNWGDAEEIPLGLGQEVGHELPFPPPESTQQLWGKTTGASLTAGEVILNL